MRNTLETSRTFPLQAKVVSNRGGGSLNRLISSGNLQAAPRLHGRTLKMQLFDGNKWRAAGDLAVFPNTAFLNNEKLFNVEFHPETTSLMFSFGRGKAHRAGRLFFTQDQGAFVGTIINKQGKMRAVRGKVLPMVYTTRRRLKADPNAQLEPWLDLTIETRWEDEISPAVARSETSRLVTSYFLGSEDVSSRTSVTTVNPKTGETTIELVPSLAPGGKKDRFVIVLALFGRSFKGTYTAANRAAYEWEGTITPDTLARNTADTASFVAFDRPAPGVSSAGQRAGGRRAKAAVPAPSSLSVQDLDNVTSIFAERTPDGRDTRPVDVAQIRAGEFLNLSLVNALSDADLRALLRVPLPPDAKPLFDRNRQFFNDYSNLAVGQLLRDTLLTDPNHPSVKRIDPAALKAKWIEMGKDPRYGELSQELYLQGYRSAVPGIQPFLENNPKKWALAYFNYLTTTALGPFQTQLASATFDNAMHRIYEWYVKLSILDPDLHSFSSDGEVDPPDGGPERSTLGQHVLGVALSALTAVMADDVQYVKDAVTPVLQLVVENAADGKTAISRYLGDKGMQQTAAATRDTLQQMISVFGGIPQFVFSISNVLTAQAAANAAALADSGDDVYEGLALLFEEGTPQRTRWASFRAVAPGVLSGLLYTVSAATLIYQFVQKIGTPGITPEKIVDEIGLGVFALVLLAKGGDRLLTLAVGDWYRVQSLRVTGFLSELAKDLASFFPASAVAPTGRLARFFTAVFGEDLAAFFARRLGPVLSVFGVVMSAIALFRDIRDGLGVRNTVFDAVNTFFALLDLAFLGVNLFLSVSWAGPVGVAVAVIGLLVSLAQFIWDQIDPPAPPPDAVDRFIAGPLKAQGLAT